MEEYTMDDFVEELKKTKQGIKDFKSQVKADHEFIMQKYDELERKIDNIGV